MSTVPNTHGYGDNPQNGRVSILPHLYKQTKILLKRTKHHELKALALSEEGQRHFFFSEKKSTTACSVNILHFSTTPHTEFLSNSQIETTRHKILLWNLSQLKFCTCTKHPTCQYPTNHAHNSSRAPKFRLSLCLKLLTSPPFPLARWHIQRTDTQERGSLPSLLTPVLTKSSPQHSTITTKFTKKV